MPNFSIRTNSWLVGSNDYMDTICVRCYSDMELTDVHIIRKHLYWPELSASRCWRKHYWLDVTECFSGYFLLDFITDRFRELCRADSCGNNRSNWLYWHKSNKLRRFFQRLNRKISCDRSWVQYIHFVISWFFFSQHSIYRTDDKRDAHPLHTSLTG